MKITKSASSAIRAAGRDRFTATISTPAEDRQGDVIVPTGIDYADYLAGGGFLLWGHDYRGMPVATAQRLWADARGFYGEYTWANHAEAKKVREAVEALGQMGISIGFMPIKSEPWGTMGTGWRYLKVQALEVSLTPVPANPECLAVLRSKGLLASGDDLVFELADDEAVLDVDFDPATVARKGALIELGDIDPRLLAEVVSDAVTRAVDRKLAALSGWLS